MMAPGCVNVLVSLGVCRFVAQEILVIFIFATVHNCFMVYTTLQINKKAFAFYLWLQQNENFGLKLKLVQRGYDIKIAFS